MSSPKKSKKIRGSWSLKDYYLWDNWCCDSRKYDGKIHRFSLCAPKIKNNKELHPDERHENAFIEHAYSNDDGRTWNDTGPCIDPQDIQKNGYTSLWSGSTTFDVNDNNQIKFIMAMTVSNKQDNGLFHQRIGISLSDDAIKWTPIDICLEYQNKYGYDYSNGDNEGLIWRDPYIWKNPNDHQYHLFFAAKKINENNEFQACIGHAICNNQNQLFNEWILQPGINIPTKFGQCELPAIIYYNNYYYLFCCCQSAKTGETCYCIFESLYVTNGWSAIFSSMVHHGYDNQNKENQLSLLPSEQSQSSQSEEEEDEKEEDEDDLKKIKNDHFLNKKIYGLSVYEDQNKKPCAVAYYDRHSSHHHFLTCTPIIPVTWNDNVIPSIPTIQYNQLLIRHDIDDELKPKLKNTGSNTSQNSESISGFSEIQV